MVCSKMCYTATQVPTQYLQLLRKKVNNSSIQAHQEPKHHHQGRRDSQYLPLGQLVIRMDNLPATWLIRAFLMNGSISHFLLQDHPLLLIIQPVQHRIQEVRSLGLLATLQLLDLTSQVILRKVLRNRQQPHYDSNQIFNKMVQVQPSIVRLHSIRAVPPIRDFYDLLDILRTGRKVKSKVLMNNTMQLRA